MTPNPAADQRATALWRHTTATASAMASSTGPATGPSNATVTAARAATADDAAQICPTGRAMANLRPPTTAVASNTAASAAAMGAATIRSTATETNTTGSVPTDVSNA